MRIALSLIGCFLITRLTIQAADFSITSFGGNGDLSWEDTNTNGTYTVQWCASLALTNWRSDWTGLTQVAATGGAIRVNVPMFFRVIHRPRQSQSANMRLVSGGGQPQGPQYDFYAAKYEVTTEEYSDFLNNAQANQSNERGANMFFNDQGDVFINSAKMNHTYAILRIVNSKLLYNNTAAVGSRYSVSPDYLGHPITGVSWYGAVKYCNWLTIRENRGLEARCYTEGPEYADWHPAHLTYAQWTDGFTDSERLYWVQNYIGYRLPMDQGDYSVSYYNEFTKMAFWNGTANTLYAVGRDAIDGMDANYSNSGDPFEEFTIKTTPVGYYDGSNHSGAFQTRSNENYYGLFDLGGNVEEWQSEYYQGISPPEHWLRGGCWVDSKIVLSRTTTESPLSTPGYVAWYYCGFRVVSTQP